jgi:hypothetical protein
LALIQLRIITPPSVSLRVRISTALVMVWPSPLPYLKLVRVGVLGLVELVAD